MSKDDPNAAPLPQPVVDPVADAAKLDAQPVAEAKDPAAVALGSRGGKARAKKLDAKQRSESARKAAQSRWKKPTDEPTG